MSLLLQKTFKDKSLRWWADKSSNYSASSGESLEYGRANIFIMFEWNVSFCTYLLPRDERKLNIESIIMSDEWNCFNRPCHFHIGSSSLCLHYDFLQQSTGSIPQIDETFNNGKRRSYVSQLRLQFFIILEKVWSHTYDDADIAIMFRALAIIFAK